MDPPCLKEKLQSLTSTQETINAVADDVIANSADAKAIVKTWNDEFRISSLNKKLTLLYLANDVLQRCKTNVFLPVFLHYLPKATAHLYKHGDGRIRTAVMRLVDVWNERNVLRSQGIAAVRLQLDKVKETPVVATIENGASEGNAGQGSKRKREGHPILEAIEDVQEAVRHRIETEQSMQQLMTKREMQNLSREEFIKLGDEAERHCTTVKTEIQIRKKTVELLKQTLTEQVHRSHRLVICCRIQEDGLKKSKGMLQVCFQRQEEIRSASILTEAVFDPRGSISLSDETIVSQLLPTSSLQYPEHPCETPSMAYSISLLPTYSHLAYGSHPVDQSVHAVNFTTMHMERLPEKAQEHEMAIYHQSPPFPGQTYPPEGQTPPLHSYESHAMHTTPGTYDHQLNFQPYQGEFEGEKDWRT